jgi:hypothetical protein
MRTATGALLCPYQRPAFNRWRMRPSDEWRILHRWQKSRVDSPVTRIQMSTLPCAQRDIGGTRSKEMLNEHGRRGFGGPWQYTLALATIAILICYADRSNISIAILDMENKFGWSESYKGTVLGIFFLGTRIELEACEDGTAKDFVRFC